MKKKWILPAIVFVLILALAPAVYYCTSCSKDGEDVVTKTQAENLVLQFLKDNSKDSAHHKYIED